MDQKTHLKMSKLGDLHFEKDKYRPKSREIEEGYLLRKSPAVMGVGGGAWGDGEVGGENMFHAHAVV